jgi:hypothetical protein
LDQNLINLVSQTLTNLLGDKNQPSHNERLAAIQTVVGNLTALIRLDDANRTAPWTAQRIMAAREYLILEPWLKNGAASILCREAAHQIAARLKNPQLVAFIEPLAHWALFEDSGIEKAETLALQKNPALNGATRWAAIYEMIAIGMWRMQSLMPSLVHHEDFRDVKLQIWSMIYGSLPDFITRYAKLHEIEVPLPKADMTRKDPSVIKVGVWSNKIGDFLSSATQVHPWLMTLPEPGLEVFIFSERRRPDAIQNKYREIYKDHFIDCDGLDDAAFLKLVTGLDLDVMIALHPSRKDLLETHRLARCHLDTWADMGIFGMADISVASQGMLVPEFVKTTNRKFIVIPDPPHVYSALPAIELKDRAAPAQFVFGAFNRAAKMNPLIFDIWARVMKECPKAALAVAFLQVDFMTEYILKSELGKRGVDPSRVAILPRVSHPEHLERHNSIDLMLDTAPLGAGMTAVDTFFMGVPLLSLSYDYRPATLHTNNAFFNVLGDVAGASVKSADAYVEYAKACYNKGPRSKAARQQLRDAATRSALFDHDGYMRLIRMVIKAAVENNGAQLTYIKDDPRRKSV